MPLTPHFAQLARLRPLAILTDLDGTLLPFAATPAAAKVDEDLIGIFCGLAEVGVQVVVVTGRPRNAVDELLARARVWCFAEHSAWRYDGDCWRGPRSSDDEVDDLAARLERLGRGFDGARLERKTLSVGIHWREVEDARRAELSAAAELAIDEWLEGQPDFERIAGVEMVEARPRSNHKGVAVAWIRQRLPGCRIIALGDDITDEDMFRHVAAEDLGICVGPTPRRSHATAMVDGIDGARSLLGWIIKARSSEVIGPPPIAERPHRASRPVRASFLVISNRTPSSDDSRRREVGGLVAALQPAIQARAGVWLGWSGQDGANTELTVEDDASPIRASFDFPPEWRSLFYGGFCNRSLWPLLHGFPGRVRYEGSEWAQYVDANATYARLAVGLVEPHGTVWVHDYHLLLVAAAMRHLGHRGPCGLFLHVPVPGVDMFETLPWARQILDAMLGFDLIGVHTTRYAENLAAIVRGVLGADVDDGVIRHRHGRTRIMALPIGIDPEPFRHDRAAEPCAEVEGLRTALGERLLVLGVDRLDYSKGIPERLEAFERLLEREEDWRRRVSMVQISVPSRADVPEYRELRDRVEKLVGRINGRFGDADWVPVRYLYRSYSHSILAQLYRLAAVAVVTPLRDGMNLVAKEFVAAQDPARPGVLLLSQFAGAAEELDAAVISNPYHRDGLADDLLRALTMHLDERRERHARLLKPVCATTSQAWAARFLDVLEQARRAAFRAD